MFKDTSHQVYIKKDLNLALGFALQGLKEFYQTDIEPMPIQKPSLLISSVEYSYLNYKIKTFISKI